METGPASARGAVAALATALGEVSTAAHGVDRPGGQAEIIREAPSLTYGQLRHVVEQDYWGAELSPSFLEAGEELEPFETSGGGGRLSG